MNKEIIILALIGSIALFSVVNAATAGTAGVSTVSGTDASKCQQGYYLVGDTNTAGASCSPCSAGKTTDAANTAATCTACTAGSYCPIGAATGTTTDQVPASCQAGFYCAASTGGLEGMTPCADGQYSAASATEAAGCLAITGSAATGCSAYTSAAATACAVPKVGYITIPRDAPLTISGGAIQKCVDGCNACTASTATSCTAAAQGFYINDFDAAAKTVNACSADGFCGECTFTKGSTATNGVINCTKAKAGAYLDATVATAKVAKACTAGKGSVEDNTGDATTCTACDATKFCANCKLTTFCTSCLPGNVLTTATGVCAAYAGVTHGTCLKANAETDTSCQSCDAAKNREMELDAAVAPATVGLPKAVGACKCKAMFGDKSKLSVPDFTCAACPTNASDCKFGATGLTEVTCASGFFKAGLTCQTSSATGVAGFFWDASGTTSAFKACTATLNCLTCNSTSCLSCPETPALVEPTSSAANFATYLKTRAIVNNGCVADCPTNFAPNSARTGCVAGAVAAKAFSKIFAVLALLASLLVIY